MSKNKKRTRMTKENRKIQIIDTAMDLFMDRGYHGTTTANIAKEAGISEVTLFRYFPSKKKLFREVVEPVLIESLEKVVVNLKQKDLESTEKLKFILKDRIEFASKNRGMIKLILMERQINPEIIQFDYIENTLSLLESSAKEAEIELNDRDLTIRILIGSILSFLYFPETNDQKVEEYIDHLVRLLKK